MFGLPSTWLIGGLMLALAATWGTMKIKHASEVTASYEKGVNAGKAASSTATVAAATATAEAEREATESTPLVIDKAAIIALCKQRASCRERGNIK